MPNHVKNSITINADAATVQQIVSELSTHYPKVESTDYDGNLIFENANGSYGWLDPKTNKFKRRDMEDVDGVPEGYEQKYNDAWTRFPDFSKIVECPLEDVESNGSLSPLENPFSKHEMMKAHFDQLLQRRERMGEESYQKHVENFLKGCKNYLLHGYATWYSWNTEHWGTKWNAYDCEKVADNAFTFDTAWSCVIDLVKKMAERYPSAEFVYEYSDEGTGSNCGSYRIKGDQVEGGAVANMSNEAYELAFKLRPDSKEYYKLVDGKYEYAEED